MKIVPNWPEYLVSELGRIYRITTKGGRAQLPKLVTPWATLAGYSQIYLSRGKLRQVVSVHRLVADLYLPSTGGSQVNHIDGDKQNNAAANLEWVTQKENIQHAMAGGKMSQVGAMKLLDSQVKELRQLRSAGSTIADLAKVFGISVRYTQQLVKNEYRKDFK